MNAGGLTEIIEVLSPNIVINDVGEQTTEYIAKLTTRANVRYDRGNRDIENNEIVYNYNISFIVRRYVDVDEFDIIRWNNKQYRILSVEPQKELQQITIQTEKINE